MNSNNTNWFRNIIIGKPQEDNSKVYRNLLNIIPNPAIIVDVPNDQILISNSEFSKFTAYSPSEITKISFSKITDMERVGIISNGENSQTEIIKRNQNSSAVVVWKYVLDEQAGIAAFVFISEQQYLEQQFSWQEDLFHTTQKLLKLIESDSLESAFQEAVNSIGEFFETPHVYIYQANSEFPELRLTMSIDSNVEFPKVIPSNDLRLDITTLIWTPGQRMYTEIQKAARILGLSYVATSTMGPGKSASALLVVGHSKNQPPKFMQSIMDIFSSTLSSLLQYFILVSALRKQLQRDVWQLNVQSEVMNLVIDGIMVLNTDFSIWFMNPSAELMLGYQKREVIGQPIENILIGPDNLAPMLESTRDEFVLQKLGIVQIHRRNGDALPVELRIVPVVENNELNAILLYLRDVSENEEIRVRAQQLESHAILGEFTAVFAHEVRNPINNISMGLQILSRSFAEDPKNKEMTERMILDCERLTHQMEAILSYSKPFDAKFEGVDIGKLIQRVVDRWKPRMARVGVTEITTQPDVLPQISADPRLLEQVFINLIGNAVEAMSGQENGTLAVNIKEVQNISNHPQIEIKIIDNGPGIPEEVSGHIFEPFVTTKKTGTGLGLAISKRIITAHRGNISVESYPVGGTVFTVYLPIKQGET
jgi:PAS domain S-box-containing protein